MLKINLQWFAYPCWLLALCWVAEGLYYAITLADESEFMPLVGYSIGITYLIFATGAGLLGWLIHRAFRPTKSCTRRTDDREDDGSRAVRDRDSV